MTEPEPVLQRVRHEIAESLGIDPDTVSPDQSLLLDLGADSLDLLDMVFRFEEAFNIRIERGQIETRIRDAMGGEPYETDGILTPKALELLRAELPEVPAERFHPGLRSSEVVSLFTVRTLVRLVERHLPATPTDGTPPAKETPP